MIETKERYEYLRKNHVDPFKEIHHEGIDGLFETIEALRKMARAAEEWADMRGRPVYDTETELMVSLDALPDWLTDG